MYTSCFFSDSNTMIDKITLTFNIYEFLTGGVSIAAPTMQFFKIKFPFTTKVTKRPSTSAIYTLTPILVLVMSLLAHLEIITVEYLESIRASWRLSSSGSVMSLKGGEFLICIGLLIFFLDILKLAAFKRKIHKNKNINGFLLSFAVFLLFTVLFFTSKNVGSSAFLVLLLLSMFDIILWYDSFVRRR